MDPLLNSEQEGGEKRMQGRQFSEYMTNDDVLQIAVQRGILNMKEIAANVDEMKRKELLSLHTHEIWQNSKGMYLTYVYDENGDRKIRRRKTKEEIEQLLVEHYRSLEEEIHLRDVFELGPSDMNGMITDVLALKSGDFTDPHPGLEQQHQAQIPHIRVLQAPPLSFFAGSSGCRSRRKHK